MNLATRCTDCGTVFRVVPDQLKVSSGWVRCGRCSAVFNAQEQLFDLDLSAPEAAQAPPAAPAPPAEPSWTRTEDEAALSVAGSAFAADRADGATAPPGALGSRVQQRHEPHIDARVATADEPVLARASAEAAAGAATDEPSALVDALDASPAVVVSIGQAATAAAEVAPAAEDDGAPTPSFLSAVERDRFWERAPVRRALSAAIVLLALVLAVQVAVLWRDEIAARSPASKPALAALCEPLGCRLSPLRRIDSLSVDASGLQRIEGAPLHRLSITLRNRADIAVLAPALELTLSDAQGGLLARRVLTLAELGVASTTIAPGAELPLQALLSTGERRLSGYTVELFYP